VIEAGHHRRGLTHITSQSQSDDARVSALETTIERRAKLHGQEHVPPGLLRLSVGVEHVEDLAAVKPVVIARVSKKPMLAGQ
jgi:hypothetical protein